MRRILRIFPLYYGFLIVFFFLLPLVWSMGEKFQSLLDQQGWYWSYLVNLPIAIDGWPPYYSLGHFWSLAVEEQFYLFWPLVVFFCGQRQLMVICAVCFLGSFGVRLGFAIAGNPLAGLVLTPARMDTLAVGAFLALVVRRPGGLKNLTRWMWPIGSMAAIILAAIFVWQRGLRELDIIVQTVGYSLIAVMFGALLVAASTSSTERRMGKVFSHPTLLFFGRYSYGLYVFHHPVVLAMRSTMLGDSGLPIYFGSQLPSLALYFAAATGISVSLALLSWHGFELQFLKLKTLFPRSTSAAPTPRKRYEISPFSQP
jgi:peptidoglycan/LPS O-acetylase OafA/YrhL